MKKVIVHLGVRYYRGRARGVACGTGNGMIHKPRNTDVPERVTCQRCLCAPYFEAAKTADRTKAKLQSPVHQESEGK